MAKKKKAAPAKAKPKEKVDPNVIEEHYEEYTFNCPVRGKVTQKVKVKKLKPKDTRNTGVVVPDQDIVDKIDKHGDLSVYSTEELEKEETNE